MAYGASFILAGDMAVAYFLVHFTRLHGRPAYRSHSVARNDPARAFRNLYRQTVPSRTDGRRKKKVSMLRLPVAQVSFEPSRALFLRFKDFWR
jgi:hypothetical protein